MSRRAYIVTYALAYIALFVSFVAVAVSCEFTVWNAEFWRSATVFFVALAVLTVSCNWCKVLGID